MKQKSTILIVDDEKIGRDVLKGLLIKQDYDLNFAESGKEALDKARDITPDLILLDIMMPDMDGFEVCQNLRSDPVLAEVPVIMITALDDRKSRLRGIESGADGFMSKPFDGIELQTRVGTITRLNRYRRLLLINRQLESKISQLSALYDILSTLNSTSDIDRILKSIVQKTQELMNAERTSIFLWDQNRGGLYPASVLQKEDSSTIQEKHIPIASEIANWVFHEGKPASVQNMNADVHFESKEGFPAKSVLCVPLRGKEEILGVLEAVNNKEGAFAEDDQDLLEAMADNIALSIERANLYRDLQKADALLRRQNAELRLSVRQKYRFENIIGNSDELIDVVKKAEQVALTDSTVLIYGETGTGKELLARVIHQSSTRSQKSFVPINCGAIPGELLESELFGHEKGAFTGATRQRIGRFEAADGGTLFLDEIGDMPLNLQVRLLRVLQEGIIQRLGSNSDIPVDVRVIAATHENLVQLISNGKFREDLYYRLRVFELELPSLRQRRSDIPLLINHFITYYSKKLGKQIRGIDDSAMNVLYDYKYPGNIRELQHLVESAMILCKGDMITADCFSKEVRDADKSDGKETSITLDIPIPKSKEELSAARSEAQEKVELMFLKEILSITNGNVTEAARRVGMNRSWLSEMISKHQLGLDQFRNVG